MKIPADFLKLFVIAACLGGALFADAFETRDVVISNQRDNVRLAGTLVTPDDSRVKAAIVLASGSGGQDRDETILHHKPFKVIAESLADKGFAVLRMDDRGVGESTGDASKVTLNSNVRDVEATANWLDSVFTDTPVGIIGHSEGGQIAVRLSPNKNIDFIVTLAAPAWAGDSIIMSQGRAIATAMTGRWDGEALQRKLLDASKSNLPYYLAHSMMYIEMANSLGEMAKVTQVQAQLNQQIDAMLSPWYREFLRYNPAEDIRRVSKPWLALNGSKDMQVLPANLESIKELNPKADTLLLEGLNHLFTPANSGSPSEYATISEPLSAAVIEAIADWLEKTTR